jgi:hypothetical protein
MSRWGVKTSKAQDEQMFSGLPFEADLDLRVNEYTCPCRKLDSAIMVMKSAEDRPRCDAAYVLDGAMDRSCQETDESSTRYNKRHTWDGRNALLPETFIPVSSPASAGLLLRVLRGVLF